MLMSEGWLDNLADTFCAKFKDWAKKLAVSTLLYLTKLGDTL